MIAHPSIAFNEFSGTAGEVTARNLNGTTVLSGRAKHKAVITTLQASSRNILAKTSRAYKQLSDSQITAWEELASHLNSALSLGETISLTAHNAFIRINENRAMLGLPLLMDAPDYRNNIPDVTIDDFWVTESYVVFSGINKVSRSHKLMVRMSSSKSAGVSSAWGAAIIVNPGMDDDWSEANVTRLYNDRIGFFPKEGDKVFLALQWMDSATGLVGRKLYLSATTSSQSQFEGELYAKRNQLTLNNVKSIREGNFIDEFNVECTAGTALINADAVVRNTTYYAGIEFIITDIPDTYQLGKAYFFTRGMGKNSLAVGLYEFNSFYSEGENQCRLYSKYGGGDSDFETFDVSAYVNF